MLYFIQGIGSLRKSTLSKKILARSRSQDKISLGCERGNLILSWVKHDKRA